MKTWIKPILCIGILANGVIGVHCMNVHASESENRKDTVSMATGKHIVHNTDELEKIKANPEGFSTSNGKIYTDEE